MTKKIRDMEQRSEDCNVRREMGANTDTRESDRRDLGQDPRRRGEVISRDKNGNILERENTSRESSERAGVGSRKINDESKNFSFNKENEEDIAGGEKIEGGEIESDTFAPNVRRDLTVRKGGRKDRNEEQDENEPDFETGRAMSDRVERQRQDTGRPGPNTQAPKGGRDNPRRQEENSSRPGSQPSGQEHRHH